MTIVILFSLKTVEVHENGLQPPFWSDSIVFNENSIASLIAELSSVDADAWCKTGHKVTIRARYTKRQRQRFDDACDSVLIENNGVTPESVCNPFQSDSTVFNENRIASVIEALMLMLGVNGP